jgi:hypothetical protein
MMRRFLVGVVVVGSGVFAGLLFNRHCPGCIDVSRVNNDCAWTGDSGGRLDLRLPRDAAHLAADAQLAEELAIRDADATFNRLYGYDGHGGLEGHARNECMAQLVTVITGRHAVTDDDVAAARGWRNISFDAVAAVSFVPIYCAGAAFACGLLFRQGPREHVAPWRIALTLTAIATTFLGVQVGQLWLGVWEAIRVRNGHISVFRVASRTVWTHHHVGVVLAGGIVAFAVVAAIWSNTTVRHSIRMSASLVGVALAATFAQVFVEHAFGYVVIGSALLLLGWVSGIERATDSPHMTVLLLH